LRRPLTQQGRSRGITSLLTTLTTALFAVNDNQSRHLFFPQRLLAPLLCRCICAFTLLFPSLPTPATLIALWRCQLSPTSSSLIPTIIAKAIPTACRCA